jgi:hypothetical protein
MHLDDRWPARLVNLRVIQLRYSNNILLWNFGGCQSLSAPVYFGTTTI